MTCSTPQSISRSILSFFMNCTRVGTALVVNEEAELVATPIGKGGEHLEHQGQDGRQPSSLPIWLRDDSKIPSVDQIQNGLLYP